MIYYTNYNPFDVNNLDLIDNWHNSIENKA